MNTDVEKKHDAEITMSAPCFQEKKGWCRDKNSSILANRRHATTKAREEAISRFIATAGTIALPKTSGLVLTRRGERAKNGGRDGGRKRRTS